MESNASTPGRPALSRRALLAGATAAPACMPTQAVAGNHPDAAIFAAIERHASMLRHEGALRAIMPADGTEAQDRWHDVFERYAKAEGAFLAKAVFGRRPTTLHGARALVAVWIREFGHAEGAEHVARIFGLATPGPNGAS